MSLASMSLGSSGLQSTPLDATHTRYLTSDLLQTPNTYHGRLFDQNTSLLMDRGMRDTCVTQDASPMSTLFSPLELRLNRVSEEHSIASGNTTYPQSQIVVERQSQKIREMEKLIQILEMDVMMWKTRFITAQETLDKLIQHGPNTGLGVLVLPTCKDLPPPLDPKDYRQVRFWTAKSFEEYRKSLIGETDGLATKKKRRGRRRKSEDDEDYHPYLEDIHGSAIPRATIAKVGQKARRIWHSLIAVGLAPSSWGKASINAYDYFYSVMLNDPEFKFLRYCDGNWKLKQWVTKAYPSWAHNHLKSCDTSDSASAPKPKNKRKRAVIDNPSPLQNDDSRNEDVAITPSSNPSLVEDVDAFASPTPSTPALDPIQAMTLADPLDELYDEVDKHAACGPASPSMLPNGNPIASASVPATTTSAPMMITTSASAPATISTSSSAPMTITTSSSAPMTITTSPSVPMTITTSPSAPASITTPCPVMATIPSSVLPLAGSSNNDPGEQDHRPAKRMKGLAVVGTGLTEKNFCMRDWLEENPNGLKDAFEKYFNALPADVRKTYKDRASAAQKDARKGKKKGMYPPLPSETAKTHSQLATAP